MTLSQARDAVAERGLQASSTTTRWDVFPDPLTRVESQNPAAERP